MKRMQRLLAALALLGSVSVAHAHGGVSMEDDICVMRIGTMRAHVAGYQPEHRATQEFCEDIPEVGRAILVIDFTDPVLRESRIEFRILRDTQKLGAKARYEALGDAAQIDADTLLKLPARTYPRGTVTVDHQFTEAGWHVGVLTATNAQTGQAVHSVFPFRVGVRSYWKYFVPFIGIIALGLLIQRLSRRRKKTA
jgi:hypothetical protein